MLITDRFAFIHQPKTGGTFVRHVIDDVCRAELSGWRGHLRQAGVLPRQYRYADTDDYHDTCHDIPAEARDLQIVSAVRNPFDYYVSFYHYGWWATHPEDSYFDFGAVLKQYPHFPNLTFDEFLSLANTHFLEYSELGPDYRGRVGYYSAQFLLYFFRFPQESCKHLAGGCSAEPPCPEEMFPVHFLRTATLNDDLCQFLERQGYEPRLLKSAKEKKPVRPAAQFKPRSGSDFKAYYSPASYRMIRDLDRLIFSLFPDISPDEPYPEWISH